MHLKTPVSQLNRVGDVLKKRLHNLGIKTAEDLLYHFPFRYEDYSQLTKIEALVDGQQVTIKGKIELIANKRSSRKRTMLTEAVISDETEQLRVIWFGQPFLTKTLKVGDTVFLSGKVKSDMLGIQMVSPAYEKETKKATTHTARIVPMYPLTAGITQKQMRFLVSQVIDLAKEINEWIPPSIQEKAGIVGLSEALQKIHFPETMQEQRQVEERLKFDELFVLQLRAEMIRQALKRAKATPIPFDEKKAKAFVDALPFELTKDQKVASWEIIQDMEKESPMNRLLEGDVGSGKTVVAAFVMHNTVQGKQQAVLMAPTEILAKQHFESLSTLLSDHMTVGLLTRSQHEMTGHSFEEKTPKTKQKKHIIDAIKSGDIDIAIGTHALLSENVSFKNLGLVIIDEQHRFGVEQRKTIKEKSGNKETTPHFLSMTATPIPRSFALTLYGDLDLSIIKEMPKGRKPVKTRVVDPRKREKAYAFIREQVEQGRQCFVVCPLIDEKEKEEGSVKPKNEKKTVLAEYEKLQKKIFPNLRVDYLHGKMKAKEKDDVMKRFQTGETQLLVSTSVIEVGVNIPNASVMMIEGAECFGLAQLHQFRGRVGRSDHQSYCLLFTDSISDKTIERLGYFEKHTDGFAVAEYDLEMRGPGEVYGKSQSGMNQFRLASMQDGALIKKARDLARDIDFNTFASLKSKVEEWEQSVHLE